MCGIAGIKRWGNVPIHEDEIKILLCASENRGNHATGVALQNDGEQEIHLYKAPVPAWSFTASEGFSAFLKEHLKPQTRTAILHTRAATCGAPYKNENNHPMFKGQTAVVHNGGISNADTLFREQKIDRSCETDSDIIRGLLDKYGFTHKAVKELSKMTGSAAFAAIRGDIPNVVLLARSGNPIEYCDANEKLYWASEFHAIQKALRPWEERHGLFLRAASVGKAFYNSMPDNTAYLIGPEGVIWRQEMKVCTFFRAPVYRGHETYHDKTKAWKLQQAEETAKQRFLDAKPKEEEKPEEKPKPQIVVIEAKAKTTPVGENLDVAQCPACGAPSGKPVGKKWADYDCHKCGEDLKELDV